MLYFMFKEKERLELESILMLELKNINAVLEKEYLKEEGKRISVRALKERTNIIMDILSKIAN